MDLRQLDRTCSIPESAPHLVTPRVSPSSCVFSLFMSPETNLVIWIDSCVTWDYKTSYVLCGRSPLSCNLVVCVCVCVDVFEKFTCWVAVVAATAQGCWLLQPGSFFFFHHILDPIKVFRLFYVSLCWFELFPTGWNHNQFVFPQAGGSLCRTSVFSWTDVGPGMTDHQFCIALYLSHNCARCFRCLRTRLNPQGLTAEITPVGQVGRSQVSSA